VANNAQNTGRFSNPKEHAMKLNASFRVAIRIDERFLRLVTILLAAMQYLHH
jgi:hypothetical protein